jgi:proline dehydrogenase
MPGPLTVGSAAGGGPDSLAADVVSVSLTEEEVALVEAMMKRMARLAEAAAAQGVRLMVDAEHTYFQPVREGGHLLGNCIAGAGLD